MHTMLPQCRSLLLFYGSPSQMLPFSLAFVFSTGPLTAPPWQAPGKIYGRELNETFWRFEVIAEIERRTTGRVTGKLIEGNASWFYRTFAYVA